MGDPVSRLNAALVGRYRIERRLGEGGMATVYLAEDLRHQRKVALKVLRPELAAVVGAERFLAEIKTTANLQHPHILPLFDSGEADGFLFFVMPYVEGESLREKLDRERQLPVDEAVRVATNVAEALDYAHRHGVIHRDIKPANILLLDGKPVVADFGIALAVNAGGAGRLTETGLSLGTPHYMSPEQATGDHTVGPATDIWALGCVLYEMLVSEPPYTGGTPQAVLGRIVTSDPEPVTKHRRAVPTHVDAAIRRALEKVPADRFVGAADFARALADRAFTHGEVAATGGARGAWNRLSVGLTALATLMTVLAAWGWLARRSGEPPVPTRGEIVGLDLDSDGGWRLAISPDGRSIVAGHREAGADPALYIRSSGSTEWQRIANTELATNPALSPDGEWIAFERGNNNDGIFRLPVAGGTPLPVVARGGEPHWTEDDQIVYRSGNEILTVPAEGGEPQLLFRVDSIFPRRPHLLPDGRALVFGEGASGGAPISRIMLYDLRTGELRALLPSGNQPRFVRTGHLLYGKADGSLEAVAFELGALATVGSPVTVLPSMMVYAGGASQFAVSDNGTLVYQTVLEAAAERRLVWVSRDGSEEVIEAEPQQYSSPRVSPDGLRAAVYVPGEERRANIYVWSFASGNGRPLLLGDDNFSHPVWSADGTRIVYSSASGGVYSQAANNTGTPELLVQVETDGNPNRQPGPYFLAPGERAIVYRDQENPATDDDLVMWSLQGDSVVWRINTPFVERNAVLSPNGRWMAYQSDESGDMEVHVRPFPNVFDDQVLVSNAGGFEPVWSRDGRDLFYLQPNQGETQLVAVSVDPRPSTGSFTYRDRRVLMPWPYWCSAENRCHDVAPDGRFLAVDAGISVQPDVVYIVANWFEELRERMGN
jgi:serine/threonine-protein kinase